MAGTAYRSGLNPTFRDFWSVPDVDDLVTLNATAADEALPDVVIDELPNGLTVVRVVAMLKFRAIEESSGASNSIVLAGTEHIQVRLSGGTFVDAIQLVAGELEVAGTSRDGGDVLIGSINIKADVKVAGTYNFQIENADVTAASLLLRGVQTGLRVSLE